MKFSVKFQAGLLAALLPGPILVAGETLPTMVVTATRTAVSQDRVLAPVAVIDRDELEMSLAPDVAELLRFRGGVEMARLGGPGQVTSVFIRGAESDHTLVLIDGVRMNSGTAGLAAIQNVSPSLIERVEIVKGPRSSLYGSEAVGGVINIITRRPEEALSVSGEAGGGRYGTRQASGGLGWSGQTSSAGLNVSWYDTDGFPTRRGSRNDAGYDNLSFNAWTDTQLGSVEIGAGHWQSGGTTEYSDFYLAPVEQDYLNRVSRVTLGARPRSSWDTRLTLSRLVDDIEQGDGAFNPKDFTKTDRIVADWQNTVRGPADLQFVGGVYAEREETSGVIFGSRLEDEPGSGDVDIDVDAFYLESAFSRGRHHALASGRYTDHELFGGQRSWNLEYGFDLSETTRVTAGTGRAFRAPSSLDLYGFGGNPELDPEISRNWEAAIVHRIGRTQELRVGGFRNEIDDLIEFVFTDPDDFVGENRNVDEARIEGVEVAYSFQGADWGFRTELTFQDAKDRTTGGRLLRRADRILTMDATRRIGAHEVGINLLATDDRVDFGDVRLAGYVLANLTSRIRLSDRWHIKARIENLLDQDYEMADGYRSAGRGVYASLAYSR
jgi:vitamin B12 transporter